MGAASPGCRCAGSPPWRREGGRAPRGIPVARAAAPHWRRLQRSSSMRTLPLALLLALSGLAAVARPQGCDDPPIDPEDTASWSFEGDAIYGRLGNALAPAGDVN